MNNELTFTVTKFKSRKTKFNSFSDMMTAQEDGTFNIVYSNGTKKIKLNKTFKSETNANAFIDSVLKVNSVLYIGSIRFKNGLLD